MVRFRLNALMARIVDTLIVWINYRRRPASLMITVVSSLRIKMGLIATRSLGKIEIRSVVFIIQERPTSPSVIGWV